MAVEWHEVGTLAGPPYTLPVATASRLGGVKVGNGLSVADDGTVALKQGDTDQLGGVTMPRYSTANRIDTGTPSSGGVTLLTKGDGYGLVPVATASQPGVVKPDGSSVTMSGTTLSVRPATTARLGGVSVDGDSVKVSAAGEVSLNYMSDDEFTAYINGESEAGGDRPVSAAQLKQALGNAGPSVKIVTWADGTDEEIAAMVAAADAGKLKLSDYWKVGDTRKVQLSAMAATGVNETHVAQQVEMVLMHAGGKTLSSGKDCSFVVGQKNLLANGTSGEYGYMNSSNTNTSGWDGCARRTWCNNIYRNAIPSSLRGIFKQFNNVTAAGAGSMFIKSADWFALPSEMEVFGSVTYADATAEASNIQFDWYKTSANRVKKVGANGSAGGWWGRSPRSSSGHSFCGVSGGGTAGWGDASYGTGLAPFGCI